MILLFQKIRRSCTVLPSERGRTYNRSASTREDLDDNFGTKTSDQNTVSRTPQSKRCGLSHVQHTELVISSLCRARATYSRRIGPRFILDHHSGKNITDIPTVISGTAKMASSTAMHSSPIDLSGRANKKNQGHWTWKLTYKSET